MSEKTDEVVYRKVIVLREVEMSFQYVRKGDLFRAVGEGADHRYAMAETDAFEAGKENGETVYEVEVHAGRLDLELAKAAMKREPFDEDGNEDTEFDLLPPEVLVQLKGL